MHSGWLKDWGDHLVTAGSVPCKKATVQLMLAYSNKSWIRLLVGMAKTLVNSDKSIMSKVKSESELRISFRKFLSLLPHAQQTRNLA